MAIRILIADRQDMFREALRRLLELQEDFTVVGDTGDGEKLAKLVAKHKPDVMLLDLQLHKQNAIEVLKQVSTMNVDVRSVLLSETIEKSDMLNALLCGARGALHKADPPHLLYKSIRAVAKGEYWVSRNGITDLVQNLQSLVMVAARNAHIQTHNLSRRQQRIVKAIVSGYSNREIAGELSISERTVKYHVTRIFNKFGVSGRMELVQNTLKNGLTNIA